LFFSYYGKINHSLKTKEGVRAMTDKQENLYSMFVVLLGFLTKWLTVVSTIPAFKRAYDKFAAYIPEIKEVDSGRKSIKSGKGDIKATKKNELAAAVFHLASCLYTYADETDKPEILNRTGNTESYYKKMRDTNLVLEAKDLIKLTTGIETALADQGLEADDITLVTNLAKEFEDASVEVGTSSAEGSTATKTVYELIGEAKTLVENQLNVHAAKFRKKNPDFYNGYVAASKVIELGVRHEKKEEEPAPAS
jgi:hypothetical protein